MVKITKQLASILALLFLAVNISACGTTANESASGGSFEEKRVDYQTVELVDAPEVVRDRYEKHKTEEVFAVISTDDNVYVMITMGEKSSGGHEILIHDVVEHLDKIEVGYSFAHPGKEEMAITALTYPVVILQLEKTNKSIAFEDMNDVE